MKKKKKDFLHNIADLAARCMYRQTKWKFRHEWTFDWESVHLVGLMKRNALHFYGKKPL